MINRVNKIFKLAALLCFLLLVSACATTKLAQNPMGDWDILVSNTPYGEMKGRLTVNGKPGSFAAVFTIQGDRITVTDYRHDGKTGKSTGSFFFEGNSVRFESQQSGSTVTGTMSAGGMDFPFKGARKE